MHSFLFFQRKKKLSSLGTLKVFCFLFNSPLLFIFISFKKKKFLCNFSQSQILEALGATVERVRPVSITHKDHYVNVARRRALEANELASKHGKYIGMDADGLVQANGHISEEEKQNSVFSSNCKGGFFADQFENLANFRAHYEGTGPEIWEQTGGDLHAFVAAAGTGGTLAGVSRSLQVIFPLHLFIKPFFCTSIVQGK